jgi:CPA1 family monovalent cation:H+ antiporter
LASGTAFPDRDLIVFITAGVIAVTLAQGMAFPAIVRWARLPQDIEVDRERRYAETRATQAALDALRQLAEDLDVEPEVVEEARDDYEQHLSVLSARSNDDDTPQLVSHHRQSVDLRRALLAVKRRTVIELRDDGAIDDIVLRQIQSHLDAEDVRLAGP